MCEGIAYGNQQCQRVCGVGIDLLGHRMCRDHKNKRTYASLMAQTRATSTIRSAPVFWASSVPFGAPAGTFGTVFGDRALDTEVAECKRMVNDVLNHQYPSPRGAVIAFITNLKHLKFAQDSTSWTVLPHAYINSSQYEHLKADLIPCFSYFDEVIRYSL